MESIVASSETHLLGSLDFRSSKTGAYLQERRSVQYHPGSGNTFSPAGIRTLRWTIAGSDWLIPETVRLGFLCRNEDPALALQPVSVLAGTMFSRLRIMSGGQILEDLDLYARQINCFAQLLPPERLYMDGSEGFGCTGLTPGLSHTDWIPEEIPPGGERRVFMSLMSGLFSQSLWLPLSYLPSLTIELTIGQYSDAFAPVYRAPPGVSCGRSPTRGCTAIYAHWTAHFLAVMRNICNRGRVW
jgi:hypothetical protein